MLKFSSQQMAAGNAIRIEAFLQRAHDHQVRVGVIHIGQEFADRRDQLEQGLHEAWQLGFEREKHLMFVMDCLELHGSAAVRAQLSTVFGPADLRVRALLDLA